MPRTVIICIFYCPRGYESRNDELSGELKTLAEAINMLILRMLAENLLAYDNFIGPGLDARIILKHLEKWVRRI
jgi:hypothetical protein